MQTHGVTHGTDPLTLEVSDVSPSKSCEKSIRRLLTQLVKFRRPVKFRCLRMTHRGFTVSVLKAMAASFEYHLAIGTVITVLLVLSKQRE